MNYKLQKIFKMATICPNTAPKSVRPSTSKLPTALPAPASMIPDYGDFLYIPCPLKWTTIFS